MKKQKYGYNFDEDESEEEEYETSSGIKNISKPEIKDSTFIQFLLNRIIKNDG